MNFLSSALCCTLSLALSACCLSGDCTDECDDPCCANASSSYGAEVSAAAPVTLVALLDDAAAQNGATVVVQGEVLEVCQNKGCWMLLSDGERSLRVTFVDYGFFVPKDLAGSTVVAEGVFSIKMVPVDEARHYLEDAGRHDEAAAITEPQKGFGLLASGIKVL